MYSINIILSIVYTAGKKKKTEYFVHLDSCTQLFLYFFIKFNLST